jgi:hypothetical protein
MIEATPIHVNTGFSWTTAAVAILNLLVGGVLVALIKSRPHLKRLANEREANLLTERAEEMELMRSRLAKLEAERAVDRHRLNNLSQCLDALLLMIELDPGKATEAAAKIRAMRERQAQEEAAEKSAIHAATITGKEPVK